MKRRFLVSAMLLVGMGGVTVGLVRSQASEAGDHQCCRGAAHTGVLMMLQKGAEKKCANTRAPNSRCVDQCRKDAMCTSGSAGSKGTKGTPDHGKGSDKGGAPGRKGEVASSCPCKKV
jgi:hypothetical protein